MSFTRLHAFGVNIRSSIQYATAAFSSGRNAITVGHDSDEIAFLYRFRINSWVVVVFFPDSCKKKKSALNKIENL